MIYSFTNLHDVSWGTKGDNTATNDEKPAAVIKNEAGEPVFHVVIPQEDHECTAVWKAFKKQVENNKMRPFVDNSKPNYAVISEDGCKEFRTKVVLLWMLCNAALIIIFTNGELLDRVFPETNQSVNPYLTFLFWSVAFFAVVRGIGSTIFVFQWWTELANDANNAPNNGSSRV